MDHCGYNELGLDNNLKIRMLLWFPVIKLQFANDDSMSFSVAVHEEIKVDRVKT